MRSPKKRQRKTATVGYKRKKVELQRRETRVPDSRIEELILRGDDRYRKSKAGGLETIYVEERESVVKARQRFLDAVEIVAPNALRELLSVAFDAGENHKSESDLVAQWAQKFGFDKADWLQLVAWRTASSFAPWPRMRIPGFSMKPIVPWCTVPFWVDREHDVPPGFIYEERTRKEISALPMPLMVSPMVDLRLPSRELAAAVNSVAKSELKYVLERELAKAQHDLVQPFAFERDEIFYWLAARHVARSSWSEIVKAARDARAKARRGNSFYVSANLTIPNVRMQVKRVATRIGFTPWSGQSRFEKARLSYCVTR